MCACFDAMSYTHNWIRSNWTPDDSYPLNWLPHKWMIMQLLILPVRYYFYLSAYIILITYLEYTLMLWFTIADPNRSRNSLFFSITHQYHYHVFWAVPIDVVCVDSPESRFAVTLMIAIQCSIQCSRQMTIHQYNAISVRGVITTCSVGCGAMNEIKKSNRVADVGCLCVITRSLGGFTVAEVFCK